jgi:hypothetical protein
VALSDRTFQGDRRVGRAAISILRNLLFASNAVRELFLERDGLTLFCSLHDELTDYDVRQAILWTVRHATMVNPKPPIEAFDPILELLSPIYGAGILGAEALEIRLSRAYVEMGPLFASQFLSALEFANLDGTFAYLSAGTQVAAFELFTSLLTYPNEVIPDVANSLIAWPEFVPKMHLSTDRKVQKSFLRFVDAIFEDRAIPKTSRRFNDFLTLFFPEVFRLIEQGILRVRVRAIETITRMLRFGSTTVLHVIVGHRIVGRVVAFLESDWTMLLKLAVEILLFVIQFALDGKSMVKVMEEIRQAELYAVIDDLCGRDIDEDVGHMADLLRGKIDELLDARIVDDADSTEEEDTTRQRPKPVPPDPPKEEESEEDEWEDA